MSMPQPVVVTARKHNKQIHVSKPNHIKEKSMNKQATANRSNVVKGNVEVAVNTRITEQFSLKLKKLAVTASLGFVAGFATHVTSLP